MQELGLPSSARQSDIHDDETKRKYWELMENPKYVHLDTLVEGARERVVTETKLGRVPIGISSGRREVLLESTRARLANLGVPVFHLILREQGNYDTDGRFKAKWAQRLATNYDLVELFERDAVVRSTIMKSIGETKTKAVD